MGFWEPANDRKTTATSEASLIPGMIVAANKVICDSRDLSAVQCNIAAHIHSHQHPAASGQREVIRMSDVQRSRTAAVSAFGEANKGVPGYCRGDHSYSKTSFEDGTRAFQQLLGAKSFEDHAPHEGASLGERHPRPRNFVTMTVGLSRHCHWASRLGG
jgi:hypothetical protein